MSFDFRYSHLAATQKLLFRARKVRAPLCLLVRPLHHAWEGWGGGSGNALHVQAMHNQSHKISHFNLSGFTACFPFSTCTSSHSFSALLLVPRRKVVVAERQCARLVKRGVFKASVLCMQSGRHACKKIPLFPLSFSLLCVLPRLNRHHWHAKPHANDVVDLGPAWLFTLVLVRYIISLCGR